MNKIIILALIKRYLANLISIDTISIYVCKQSLDNYQVYK